MKTKSLREYPLNYCKCAKLWYMLGGCPFKGHSRSAGIAYLFPATSMPIFRLRDSLPNEISPTHMARPRLVPHRGLLRTTGMRTDILFRLPGLSRTSKGVQISKTNATNRRQVSRGIQDLTHMSLQAVNCKGQVLHPAGTICGFRNRIGLRARGSIALTYMKNRMP